MNFIKIISLLLFFNVFLISADLVMAQKKDVCPEIKYLDFFGISDSEKIEWSDKEINDLLKQNFSQDEFATNFLIPPIVFQLKTFYPACNQSATNSNRFDNLVELCFKIRRKDFSALKNKTISEQLNFIQEDYYEQLKDERLLARMRYTTDDGPLFGEIPKRVPKLKPSETITVDFGKISIIKLDNQIFLVATNEQGKKIWARILTGANSNRYLTNLKYDDENIEKTSLATIYYFYSEGERLSLFLKPNGEFMYYLHSW